MRSQSLGILAWFMTGILLSGCGEAFVPLDRDSPSARRTKITYDLQEIRKAAEMIRITIGQWPKSIDGMVNATHPETGEQIAGSLKKLPKDPWGNPYQYEVINDEVVVRCLGKDGVVGGEGENADIIYPDVEGEGE